MFTNITVISKLCCSVLSFTRDLRRNVNIVCVMVSPEISHINIFRMKMVNSLYCMIYYRYLM